MFANLRFEFVSDFVFRISDFRAASLRWLWDTVRLVSGNPVIDRELKVRVRFARAFYLQGAYLMFLIVIISLAYQGIIARQPLSNPAGLQSRLQGFYYTILYSLIGIVVLIAPALTSGAISFERERRTMDLLLMSPIKPGGILIGKLIASFAFLLLLLVLSMPVTTVCILFGGATVSDLLATYAIIAFDALHLCALALYCSTVSNASGTATFRAYLSTLGLLFITIPFISFCLAAMFMPFGGGGATVSFPLSSLHPFAAPLIKALPAQLLGVKFPCWIVCGIFSLLLTRMWLTGAAARLGAPGNPTGSLRRQGLLLTFLAVMSVDTFGSTARYMGGMPFMLSPSVLTYLAIVFLLFLPWIATFGEHDGRPPADDGWFRPARMFQPVASGALPFLLTWLCVSVAPVLFMVIRSSSGASFPPYLPTGWGSSTRISVWQPLLAAMTYMVVVATFLWSVGRFWSVIAKNLKQARGLTLGTLIAIFVLPGFAHWSLFGPIVELLSHGKPSDFMEAIYSHTSVVFIITLFLNLFIHIYRTEHPQLGRHGNEVR